MRIIAVTGPDGAGKSTACALAAELLQSRGVKAAQVSIWDVINTPGLFSGREAVVRYLASLEGPTRTLFLFHALAQSIDMARRQGANVALVEGYWYKYAVTEMGQGVDPAVVIAAARGFAPPEATLCLDLTPEKAWARKAGTVSEYEKGKGSAGSDGERFMGFQRKLMPFWDFVEKETGPWRHLSAELPREDLAEAIVKECAL